jgi:serine beta-lactamase-like protein LACTB, mitochondrial
MWRSTFRLVAVLSLGLAPLPALAQATPGKRLPAVKAAAVDEAIEAEMAKQQVVGVAVGILQDGQIVYLKGYGQSDREKRTPVTTETVFNWASCSKSLAAVAAMQLVDKKLLDLDADLRKYVPEFPDKGAVITCRHLLAHQSGIPHYSNGLVIPTNGRDSNAQLLTDPIGALNKFNRSPLLFQPGEKTSYSSYAYILLSAVIQRAGKDRFANQVRDRIARPLAMRTLQIDVESKNQENWAAGYTKNKKGQVVLAAEEANYWKHGAGAYKSNVGDFARWAQALINRELVSEEAEMQMWTRQKMAGGDMSKWGLGFVIEDQGGLKVSHNGAQREVTTRFVIYPKARHGVVVMCNCEFASIGKFSTAVYSALNRE